MGLLGIFNRRREFSYRCAACGELHQGAPSFGYARPPYYFTVPEDEREARIALSDDLCRIEPGLHEDEPVFAIRACLEIPIAGAEEPFLWGVWVSQSEENFQQYLEQFDKDTRGAASFGWMAVVMPVYDRTAEGERYESLACDVLWGDAGERPKLRLHEGDHPLIADARKGISWERAVMLATAAMHV